MKRIDQGRNEDSFSEQRYREEDSYIRAKKKLEKLVGFYWHLAAYVVVNTFLIILIGSQRNDGEGFWNFGTFATAFFWGIGLIFHFLAVFGPDFMFGKNWEEKKIKEYMNKDNEEQRKF